MGKEVRDSNGCDVDASNDNIHPPPSTHHLIVISAYKEQLNLLVETIETLAVQSTASTNVTLTLDLEERTP